jgi:hypothetical protein
MAGTSHKLNNEYWQPPAPIPFPLIVSPGEACPECATESIPGGRFCHVCGARRNAVLPANSDWTRWLDLEFIRKDLGLTTGAVTALVIGAICAIAAMVTGLLYSVNTLGEWQTVQKWRTQWLLAAAAAFLAGLLLKRHAPRSSTAEDAKDAEEK